MKTENTPEAKMRFFALYWGQNTVCIRISDAPDKKGFAVDLCDWKVAHKDSYLELTPLSQISDEDAIEVGEIINVSNWKCIQAWDNPNTDTCKIAVTFSDKKGEDGYGGMVKIYPNGEIDWEYDNKYKWGGHSLRLLKAYDFLRSRGYYVGDGTEIEYGWVKLKQK